MTRTLASIGLALALGMTAAAQPPAPKDPPKKETPAPLKDPTSPDVVLEFLTPLPPADLGAALATALKNHPDIRLAEAKRQVAEAELAQAKLAVAQKVTTAHAKVAQAKAKVAAAERSMEVVRHQHAAARVLPQAVVQAEADLAAAKANLAAVEAEFRAAVGLAPGTPVAAQEKAGGGTIALAPTWLNLQPYATFDFTGMMAFPRAKPPAGSAADKLRQLVDKRVTLDAKGRVPFDEAMQDFLARSGLNDVTVRYPDWASAKMLKDPPKVGPLQGEQTVAGWFQLILDDFNAEVAAGKALPEQEKKKYEAYVRDYGVLVTQVGLAPPGAMTLAEFARQVRAEKAAEAAKPEPKK